MAGTMGESVLNWNGYSMTKWVRRHEWVSIDLLLIVLIVLCLIGLSIMAMLIPFKAHAAACLLIDVPPQAVLNNYDGDTFTIFHFGPGGQLDIRVAGIDTPERNKKEPGWEAARLFTKTWLAAGPFRMTTCGKKSITRIEAQVERNGETLGDALRKAGHAK